MDAVIMTGGKQYKVSAGDEIKVEKLSGEVGARVEFDRILLTSDGEKVIVGKPYVEKAKVIGRIVREAKDRKVLVFKYKRRKGYRRTKGHRQPFTHVKIEEIK
jgi:large subunit ribosomal protein L21